MIKEIIQQLKNLSALESSLLTFVITSIISIFIFFTKRKLDQEKFKFTKYYELQIDKMSSLYSFYIVFCIQNELLLQWKENSENSFESLLKIRGKCLHDLFDFYHKNRILIPDKIRNELSDFIDENVEISNKINPLEEYIDEYEFYYAERFPEEMELKESKRMYQKFKLLSSKKKKDYKEVRKILESEFKKIAQDKI